MYRIAIKFANNDDDNHIETRLVKSMPMVGDFIRVSLNDSIGCTFFIKTVKVVAIQHTAFVEKYIDQYHKFEVDAVIIVRDYDEALMR